MTRDHHDESSAQAREPDPAENSLDEQAFQPFDFHDFSKWLELELAQLVSDYRDFSTLQSALRRR